jgi:hypothetical protein
MKGNSSGDTGVASAWNSKTLVALHSYRISRTDKKEKPSLHLDTSPVDYATFCGTVLSLDEEFERIDGNGVKVQTTLRRDYLTAEDTVLKPVPFLANGLGVVLLAFTDDDKALLGRRRQTAKARKGERDVSVVEGIHAKLDPEPPAALSP